MRDIAKMSTNDEIGAPDRVLLRILQSQGRLSNQDLAEAAGMSTSACWRRVKSLEEKGLIERYAALLNAQKCGLKFHAVVYVVMVRHQSGLVQPFIDAVMARPEVLDCFATTGDADYHLRVRCRDQDAYNIFLEDFLFNLEGVANVRTNVILRQLKHHTALAL